MNPALDTQHSAAVIASAGTGKTWTLTARILRLLLAGAKPAGILALTFTRKAAAEMRERVAERLQQLAYASEHELSQQLQQLEAPDDAATCRRARQLFEQHCFASQPLRALTLHGFCAELLSHFAIEAEVPSGFTLLEDERELRWLATEQLLRQVHREADSATGKAFQTLLDLGLDERQIHQLLGQFIEQRAGWWAAASAYPGDEVAGLSQALQHSLQLEHSDIQTPTQAIDSDALSCKIKLLYGLLSSTGGFTYLKAAPFEGALESQGEQRLAALQAGLFTGQGTPRSRKGGKFTPEQSGTLKQLLDDVQQATEVSLAVSLKVKTLARSAAGLTLGAKLLECFETAQQRARVLGFAELEWKTCQLLRNSEHAEWVRCKLDARLEHLLLDEFQDTNPTQWRLLLPLLEEFAASPGDGRTAFLVGDAKQSIYGFRGADAALLGTASDWLQQQLGAQLSALNESRRSAPAIMRFVNALFAGEDGLAIGFAEHCAHANLLPVYGAIELAPLIQADAKARRSRAVPDQLRNPLTTPFSEVEETLAQREAQQVAARICALIEDQTPVTHGSISRPMQYGDVMVLARARTHLGALEAALAAAGVPYLSATRSTLLDTPLAQDLLALLRLLNAPHRNLDLAQVLKSPLFAASEADLLMLARLAKESSTGWWPSLLALPDPSSPALARAINLLPQWHALAALLPPHDLLDRIASQGDVLRRMQSAYPLDFRLAGNLSALLQLALDADQGRYPSLGAFLRHCEELQLGEGPDEAAPASTEARVRVLTVHGAKGLEAPAVFLVNTAPKAQAAKGGWKLDWPSAAPVPLFLLHAGSKEDQDPLSQRLMASHAQLEAQENLHLLYVAVTRARQYLYVSGFAANAESDAPSWHSRCRTALARLNASVDDNPAATLSFDLGEPPQTLLAAPKAVPTPNLPAELRVPLSSEPRIERDGSPVDARAVLRGRMIHALLERLAPATHSLPASPDLHTAISQQLQVSLPVGDFTAALEEAQRVLAAPDLARFFNPQHKAWNELPLLLPDTSGKPERRVIDRLVDDGEQLWIIDYKTRVSADEHRLLADSSQQLRAYELAIQGIFIGRRICTGIIATHSRKWLASDPG